MFNRHPGLQNPSLRLDRMHPRNRVSLQTGASDPAIRAGYSHLNRPVPALFATWLTRGMDSRSTYTGLTSLDWGRAVNLEIKPHRLDQGVRHPEPVWFEIAPRTIHSQNAGLTCGTRFNRNEGIPTTDTPATGRCDHRIKQTWTTGAAQ